MKGNSDWFFVLGAQKAGTSTLHEWLSQSPEVALPWTKETHFFSDEAKFAKGFEWYLSQFKNVGPGVKIFGEVDPEYMYLPGCTERISFFCRAPRLIIVLRDPVLRALSSYRMSQRRGHETLTFYDALLAEKQRLANGGEFSQIHHSYVERGLYSRQIKRVMAGLPDSNLLVLKFEDLYGSQEFADEAIKKISNFIGIDSSEIRVDVTIKHNEAAEPVCPKLNAFINRKGLLKSLLGKAIPSRELKIKTIKLVEKMNTKPADGRMRDNYISGENCPSFVYDMFVSDLTALQKLVDVDVSDWIARYQRFL